MTETMPELAVQEYPDPDAQATITDFVDYTEFFPSDLIRSLTLIGSLDQAYQQHAQTVHELTKVYGCLPTLPANERPEPRVLRKEISEILDHAIRCRESSFAEATRLCDNVNRLHDRLAGIKKKLLAMPKPPSRDPTPSPQSPNLSRTKRFDNARASMFGYYAGGNRSAGMISRGRPKRLSNNVVFPGQVLPPLEIGSAGLSETSDYESESSEVPMASTNYSLLVRKDKSGSQKIRKSLKGDKIKVVRIPKTRPPGTMGTNVHSIVAGISTSNAIALLEKPPDDAQIGSRHLPWLKLTEYEMAMLRKKMKKNAIWHPSPTMVRRELTNRGRGLENYKRAKQHAEATGEPFIDEDPTATDNRTLMPNDLASDPSEFSITNRGMLLNEAKRLKRESLMKEQAARDAMEIEETGRKIAFASEFLANLFNPPQQSPEAPKTNKKRKRDGNQNQDPGSHNTPLSSKKIKLPLASAATTTTIPLAPPGSTGTSSGRLKEKTPTLRLRHATPNKIATRDPSPPDIISDDMASEAGVIRTQQAPKQPIPRPLQGLKIKFRPSPSTEPPSRKASLRNSSSSSNSSSNLSSPKDLNPPIRVVPPPKVNKRTDPVLEQSAGVTGPRLILKRPSAPNKKGADGNTSADLDDVDPDEPRYCICGGVSWGDMVACDNDNCKKEWFHWECVGLTESPARREKWYCPDCQKSLGVDVRGVSTKQKTRR